MKKILLPFLLLFAACGGTSLVNSNTDTGVTGTLSMGVAHHLSDGSTRVTTGGVKTFINDEGYQISLSEAEVGWARLILISGGSASFPECVAGRDVSLNLLGADDILGTDLSSISVLTNQNIQQISYCRYQIVLGPTTSPAGLILQNSDLNPRAHSTSETPSGSALPTTVTYHFQGTWNKGSTSGTFNYERTEAITLLPRDFQVIESGSVVAHPLHFHAGSTHEDIAFELHYDTLFSGIDFQLQSAEEEQTNLNSNFSESIHQTITSD